VFLCLQERSPEAFKMFMTMVHERCAPCVAPTDLPTMRLDASYQLGVGAIRTLRLELRCVLSYSFEVTRVPTSDLDFADEECVLLELRCHDGGGEGADGPCATSSSGGDRQPRRDDEQELGEPAADSRRRRRESDTGEASGAQQLNKEKTGKSKKKKRKGMVVD
jgi:hypothetical protein